MDSKGRQLHAQAAHLREEGKSVEALGIYNQALVAYQEEGDDLGFTEALADECISLRHLHQKTDDKKWLILAQHLADASVEIARSSGQKEALSTPLLQSGNVYEALGDFERAAKDYKEAAENYTDNNRPAYLASIKIHQSYAEYKNGDKDAKARLLENLKDLEDSEEVKYNKDVWTSGAYMSLAEMLKNDEPEEAKEYLQKAKEIIDSNPDLTLRKTQLEKLSQEFK